ncbi:unnamed protein product [Closterium sp. Naga37s-1]|nr:unnamed protein product [Closterium sp. Naga37s-1]
MSNAAADLARLVADVAGGRADVVIGHSMGGKIALEYVRRARAGELPVMLPQQVGGKDGNELWVLDSVPGRISDCTLGEDAERRDVERVIATLQELPRPIPSKRWLLQELTQRRGFSSGLAEWLATSLRPIAGSAGSATAGAGVNREMDWVFNLDGAVSLYNSYRQTDLLPFVKNLCNRPHEEHHPPPQAPPLQFHPRQSQELQVERIGREVQSEPKFVKPGAGEGVKWGLVQQPWHQPMQTQAQKVQQQQQQHQLEQQEEGEVPTEKQVECGCTQVHFVKGERSGVWKAKCLADLEEAVAESAKCEEESLDSLRNEGDEGGKKGCRAHLHVLKGAGHWQSRDAFFACLPATRSLPPLLSPLISDMACPGARREGLRLLRSIYDVGVVAAWRAPVTHGAAAAAAMPMAQQVVGGDIAPAGARFASQLAVRNRMKSVRSIQKITKAMKMVAASKLRGVQGKTEQSRGMWQPFTALLGDNPTLVTPRTLIIAVSTDRGLCGGINSTVVKHSRAVSAISAPSEENKSVFVILGEKAKLQLQRDANNTILMTVADTQKQGINFTQTSMIVDEILKNVEFDTARIIYNRFNSVVAFVPTVSTVLSPETLLKEAAEGGSASQLAEYEIEGEEGQEELFQNLSEFQLASLTLLCASLCCASLCCASLCCASLCCASLCCASLCCASLCCASLCCASLCTPLCPSLPQTLYNAQLENVCSEQRSTMRSWRMRAVSRERACQQWTTPPATPPTCLAASPSPTTGLARPPSPRSLSRLFLVLRLLRAKANAVVTDLWYYCDCTLA